jgi:small conductance mechanosensitive channel
VDESFWDSHGNQVEAAIIMIAAVVLALLVDRFLLGRAVRATEGMETSQFSREARTRLGLVRRLVFVGIIVLGLGLALSQFTEIRRLATAVLASTAVLGLIIGFAAQTVLANFVAGVLMAIRQPIRIGDLITLGDVTLGEVHGRVRDIALTYTSVDRGDGSLLVIPNAKVITEVVVNHSAGNHRAPVAVEVWLAADADLEAARKALEGSEVTGLRLQELGPEGARVELKASIEPGRDREARAADVRERAQNAFRRAGLLRPA